MDNPENKTASEELENAAIEEILKETKKAATRAEIGGPSGWTTKRKGLNRRFVNNTVINTISQNSRVDRKHQGSAGKYKLPTLHIPLSAPTRKALPTPPAKTTTTAPPKPQNISSIKKSSHFKQCLKLYATTKQSQEKNQLEKLEIEKRDEKTAGGDVNDTRVGEDLDTAW